MNKISNSKISIITATYNNARFLPETVKSVLSQSHQNFEWLVVDNGSEDDSVAIVKAENDKRIRLISLEENIGVSAARNLGLDQMGGDAFCFLDGDDVLPERSLEARLEVLFARPETQFVDGKVITFEDSTGVALATYQPTFSGKVFDRLLQLDSSVFMGNTWMIKRKDEQRYKFNEDMTHAEELLFYIGLAHLGDYDFTSECVLRYRKHGKSAMSDLDGLNRGYHQLLKEVSRLDHVSSNKVQMLTKKLKIVMTKSYLKNGEYFKALRRIIWGFEDQ